MARNPVTPVIPVNPVGAVRPVDSGSTYFRHLELWQITSEVNAFERRRKLDKNRADNAFKNYLIEEEKGRK